MPQAISIDGVLYDQYSTEESGFASIIAKEHSRLGFPDGSEQLKSATEKEFLNIITSLWTKLFRKEYAALLYDREKEMEHERLISASLKAGGMGIAAFPTSYYFLVKRLLPKLKISNREVQQRFLRLHPMFKTTKYNV